MSVSQTLWFSLKNDNLGLIIKILKFLEIPPVYWKSYSCCSSIFFSPTNRYDGNVSDIESKGGNIAASKPGMNEDGYV